MRNNTNILFPFTDSEIDELGVTETEVSGFKRVKGKNPKEMLETAKSAYKEVSTVTLDEYCDIVYEWLLLNKKCFSVLEFYEDESNRPFEYPMEEVEKNERICHLLEQRTINLCLTGSAFRYNNFGSMLMCNRFGWLTSRPATVEKEETKPDNGADDTPVQFKFGN